MAKVALLIGIAEYESDDFSNLNAPANDINAIEEVLRNPKIGNFDIVKLLPNPKAQEMRVEIERFFANREKDDLLLLYFSGHGIKNDLGNLFFATCDTDKKLTSTALDASFVHNIMNTSRSKRQVLILDCCFSGAFARGMNAKGDFVDIKNQLGGKGRAILTSSTSTQYSFEQQGSKISTYTRYIVEGLATGAADRDEDNWISVDELHEYAQTKVKEVAPVMNPEIYAIKEGYKIILAQAPSGDPKVKYRKEVDYLAKNRKGNISHIGRKTLDVLIDELGLKSTEATAIEDQVLEPFRKYQKKLEQYEETYREAIQKEYPISNNTRADFKRFQAQLQLTDGDIANIENRIITEREKKLQEYDEVYRKAIRWGFYLSDISREELKSIQQKLELTNKDVKPIHDKYQRPSRLGNIPLNKILVGGTGILFFLLIAVFLSKFINPSTTSEVNQNPVTAEKCDVGSVTNSEDLKISLGRKFLIPDDGNINKQKVIEGIKNTDCETTITKLSSYLVKEKNGDYPIALKENDPEALIYWNNFKAKNNNPLKIAVSLPTSKEPNQSKEILRGVAHAQNEVNSSGGINGRLLQVAIANDDEDEDTAKKIANALVQNEKILGVVGHISSPVTLAVASDYKQGKLAIISPTNTSAKISNLSSYVFRTAISDKKTASFLADYMVKTLNKKNVAIFYNHKNGYSWNFQDDFAAKIQDRGKVQKFDLSKEDFEPSERLQEAINRGAKILMLIPDNKTLNKAIEVIKLAEPNNLPLLGADVLYAPEIITEIATQAENMVIPISWHIDLYKQSKFVEDSKKLWNNADVNWRTVNAYDATKALIAGLEKNPTRNGVQKALASGEVLTQGAYDDLKFLRSGDRDSEVILVQVQKKNNGYKFVPCSVPSIENNLENQNTLEPCRI